MILPALFILLLAFSIGAGDTCNSISTVVGSRLLTLRRALLLSALAMFLGMLLEGGKVGGTVARGLVFGEGGGFFELVPVAAIAVCLSTFLCHLPFLLVGLPISTTQTLVASLLGAGLVLGGGLRLEAGRFGLVVTGWVLAPLLSMGFSLLLSHLFLKLLGRVKNLLTLNRVLRFLLPSVSFYVGYSNGANDGGTLLGVATALGQSRWLLLGMGLMVVLGTLVLSERTVLTVGKGITRLDPVLALPTQLAASLSVWSFVQMGSPVSMTQALVGSVMGAGLVKGVTAVDFSRVRRILLGWILSPLAGFALSLLFSLGLSP
ncbi:MAG: inorganic phosphate transporter [Candidatus Hadarchaeales archaeon]